MSSSRGWTCRWLAAAFAFCLAMLSASSAAHAAVITVPSRISSDATWTSGNTYRLTGRVQVSNSATLKVQPGARIEGNGNSLEVFGTFEAVGKSGSPVVMRNLHLRGLGISAFPSLLETFTVTVSRADIDGGSLQAGGGSMYGCWTLTDSVISNTSGPMYLWFPGDECVIARNAFINAARISCGVSEADVSITGNTFFRSSAPASAKDACIDNWAAYGAGQVLVQGNTFLNPGFLTVAVPEFTGVPKMTATGNYWGSTTTSVIESMIFDRNDDLGSPGIVPFKPFLGAAPSVLPGLPMTTKVAMQASPTVPAYRKPVTVTGTLLDSRNAPVSGAPLQLQISPDGKSWRTVKTLRTNAAGAVSTTTVLTSRHWLRLRYEGANTLLRGGVTATKRITPKVALKKPRISVKSPVAKQKVRIKGYLKPRHTAGKRSVKLYMYRYEKVNGVRKWRYKKSVRMTNSDYKHYTKYSKRLSFPSSGRWRIRAYHDDAAHARTYSPYLYVRVR